MVKRMLYAWCVLVCAVFSISISSSGKGIYRYLAVYDSSRWVHFLAYAAVATIPVALWQRRISILISFIPAFLGIALETYLAGTPVPALRAQTIPADLFGVAAGILFGLNLRLIRRATKTANTEGSSPTSTIIS